MKCKIMYRFFNVIIAAILCFAVSCDHVADEPSGANPTFELTSDTVVNVAAEGGNFVIAYTLNNGDHTAIKAEADNTDIITSIKAAQKGYIIVTVAANEEYVEREASIRVSYESEAYIITVKQDGLDYEVVNIAANQLVGNYYGDNLNDGVGHYWIILTENGFVDGAAVAGGEYFRLDLMAPMPADEDNVRIPDGEYTYDLSLSYKEYTIVNIGNTDYSWVDENMEGWALALDDAKLTVSGNHFELVAVVGATEFHVTFDGDYSLTTSVISDCVSSLTQDAVIDVSNCSASVNSYGDYWECGYNNWCIEFVCNAGMKYGTYLVIDFLNNSTTDFTGTYVASGFSAEDETKPDFRSNVFVPGFRVADDADLLLGSLYMVYKDGLCVSQAPLYGGTVTITSNNDGTYTIVIDATDDADPEHKITLNWTGKLN